MATFPKGMNFASKAASTGPSESGSAPRISEPGMAHATQPALEVARLSHRFGTRKVLQDVSFTVQAGEFVALLGPNGAGKTTLFSLVTRLYDHREGTIRVFGAAVKAAPAAALSRMGIVFQQPTLDLDLTLRQNLLYHAALHGISRRVAHERIAREIARLDMEERLRDKARLLSGGQRRRVEIARALLHDPALLLLDEPTVGLDLASRRFLLDHVHRLCRERGIGVLWATHLIDEADEAARVIVLHRGRVIADGPPSAICSATGAADMRQAFDALTRATS